MKVYVDELPDSCVGCPCLDSEFSRCNLSLEDVTCVVVGNRKLEYFKYIDNRHPTCLLQSLSDYTKQVRKEVVQQVYKVLEQAVPHSLSWSWAVINKELKKIQGETDEK